LFKYLSEFSKFNLQDPRAHSFDMSQSAIWDIRSLVGERQLRSKRL